MRGKKVRDRLASLSNKNLALIIKPKTAGTRNKLDLGIKREEVRE